jgi:hypothetical protein
LTDKSKKSPLTRRYERQRYRKKPNETDWGSNETGQGEQTETVETDRGSRDSHKRTETDRDQAGDRQRQTGTVRDSIDR